MASRLEATSALLLEKYDGDMSKLRQAAGKDSELRKLVKQFKVGPHHLQCCSAHICHAAAAVNIVQEDDKIFVRKT